MAVAVTSVDSRKVCDSRCMCVRMQRLLVLLLVVVVGCVVQAYGGMLLMHRTGNGNRNWGVHCRGTPSCRIRIRATWHRTRIELHRTRSGGGGGGSRTIGSR
jgi:hypothetical protein